MDGSIIPIEQMTYWHALLVAGSLGVGWFLKNKTPLDNELIPAALFIGGATVGQFSGFEDWLAAGLLSAAGSTITHQLLVFIKGKTGGTK